MLFGLSTAVFRNVCDGATQRKDWVKDLQLPPGPPHRM